MSKQRRWRFNRSRDGIERATLRVEIRLEPEQVRELEAICSSRSVTVEQFVQEGFWWRYIQGSEDLYHEQQEQARLLKHEQTDDLIGEEG